MEIISRSAARRKGLTKYFVASECANGHVSERYVSSAGCVACERAARRRQKLLAACEMSSFRSFDAKVSAPAEVVERMTPVCESRDLTGRILGDPEPGRSALAMRKGVFNVQA